jgi:hypothetical protein
LATISKAFPTVDRRARVRFRYLTWKRAGLILLAMLLGIGVYFRYEYKGFTTGLYYQTRYATAGENKNLWFCIDYWLKYMQMLKFNDATGFYGFDNVDESRMNLSERGRLAFHRGEFPLAVSLIEQDINSFGESEDKLFWLGMSYMRQAESANCLAQLTAGRDHQAQNQLLAQHFHENQSEMQQLCALPLTRFHQQPDSARAAARAFEKLLDNYDHNNQLYQWLLNFNYMTVNGFPQEVPPKYLIKSKFIDSFYGDKKKEIAAEFATLSFTDRAHELGVDTFNSGKGVAVEDFDGDGYLDIVTGGNFDTVKFYRNDHGQKFIDRTEAAGLGGIKQPFVISSADYDNDGLPDLFFARPFGNYALYKNKGDGTFTDVTAASGLLTAKPADHIAATWVAAWSDVNNDGQLDLFLAQWGFKLPFVKNLMAKPRMDSTLFINENGHFVDRTKEFGLQETVEDNYFIGATFGDYDNDGYPDLFLSSPLRNTSVLLRNTSGKRFERTNLINGEQGGFVASFLDFNHDGRLDLYWAGFADAKTSTEQAVFGAHLGEFHSGQTRILLQTSDGKFVERTDIFDLAMSTMGSSFGDLNNDGCYDFYLGTGTPESWFVLPNLMYLSKTAGTKCTDALTNISMLQGFGTIQKGHGIVFFDFNNDGKEDVYSSLGGMWPADKWPNQFFVNNSTTGNHWVDVRLRGRRTNYFGVGATIKVMAENQRQEEIVRRYQMDNKTGFGSAPYLAHIGLMNATRIKGIEVYWPVSRCWKTYQAGLDKLNTLDEEDCLQDRTAAR